MKRFRSFSVSKYDAEIFAWTFFEEAEKRSDCCLVSIYHQGVVRNPKADGRSRWRRKGAGADSVRHPVLQVIVFFEEPPFKAERPRRERKQLREWGEWGAKHSSLCINERTELPILVKQLAVCLKKGGLADQEIDDLLYSGDSDIKRRKNRYVYDNLINNFVNPEHPGAFGAQRRWLFFQWDREFVASTGGHLENDGCTVREAAKMLGIPKSTLYRIVRGLDVGRDARNRIRLTASNFQEVQELTRGHGNRQNLRKLKTALAKSTGAKRHNVRMRVNRMCASGHDLFEIVKRLVPPEALDRFLEELSVSLEERGLYMEALSVH